MSRIDAGRWLALGGYFGLFLLILVWTSLVDPPRHLPRSLVLLVLLLPLLAPLRGLLHGRVRTHAWTSLLSLFYVAVGITLAAVAADRVYGLAMLTLALLLFAGSLLYVRAARASGS
ncbi:DUF2069 domain-containing protein [Thioalkalivibrio sp.]|uniref:DUF2069 domain-containing protein n=1 Tax=Thioalkalivibrio sp. TaxID=2093813 RepID=UPI003565113D